MKRTLLLLALLAACATLATAQTKTTETVTTRDSSGKESTVQVTRVGSEEDITPRNNLITINPLKFFLMYNINYYRRISDLVVIGGGIQTPSLSAIGGYGLQAEVRLHPSRKAMRGFYVAPNISFNQFWESELSSSRATAFSVGVLAGWQWFPGDEFALGLGIGYDHYFLSAGDSDIDTFGSYDGGLPALRFDIGYAF